MSSKKEILNGIVANAAEIMKARKEQNEMMLDQLEGKEGCEETVRLLKQENERIDRAVQTMEKYAGRWHIS